MSLTSIPTCDLVYELTQRDGVLTFDVKAHGSGAVTVPGPATVLAVID